MTEIEPAVKRPRPGVEHAHGATSVGGQTEQQPVGCVRLSVTLVGVSNRLQIVRPADEKRLYSVVQHHPTA